MFCKARKFDYFSSYQDMDMFEEDSDYFEEDNEYFGFNEDAVPRQKKDQNCNALYEGNLFSSIKPDSEYISVEQETKYGHEGPTACSCSCCCCSSPLFSVRQETTGYKKPAVVPAVVPPGNPCSAVAQHLDSDPLQDEGPVNVMSDMFQLPDFLETDSQSTELGSKNTLQRKQEKNPRKPRLLFEQPEKSSGNMNPRVLMELHQIRRPSGRNDRHRKVVTSRGPRDRRMRLSIETAIKFFEVQDRLGFDQPSKAVEWLIQKSRSAIDQLPAISPSALDISSYLKSNSDTLFCFPNRDADNSRADFATGFEEKIVIADFLSPSLISAPSIVKEQSRSKCKTGNPRKSSVIGALVNKTVRRRHIASLKEIRSRARERARERTKEKSYTKGSATSPSQNINHTTAPEIEPLTFQENTASASSENTQMDTVEASVSHLYSVAPTFKIGEQKKPLKRVFHHHGCPLPAQDSVSELAENSYLSGQSNLYFNYSQGEIQSSVQTVAQCYKNPPEDISMESTGSFTDLCSITCPPAVPAMDVDLQSKISHSYVDYSLLQSSCIRIP